MKTNSKMDQYGCADLRLSPAISGLSWPIKTSRIDTMSDVFHRLMVTGDIVISSKSLKKPKTNSLSSEVIDMLKDPSLCPPVS